MAHNTIGKLFSITSFGESHGKSIGIVIDGFPSDCEIDLAYIQKQLDRRRPGNNALSTPRIEHDQLQVLSGIHNGKSTGAPITFTIQNNDVQSKDYESVKNLYRPGHADFTYQTKYTNRDYKGGGRSSARITAGWVAAGALAQHYLESKYNIQISAYVNQVGNLIAPVDTTIYSQNEIDKNAIRCPYSIAIEMENMIAQLKENGDSIGGKIKCSITGMPAGIGEPIFNKLNATLSFYLMNINAVRSIEIGNAHEIISKPGSKVNDVALENGKFKTTNNNAGILGGISTGENIELYIGFKPTSSISQMQAMYNNQLEIEQTKINGRHDPCVLPRAVPIVESMVACALLDLILQSKQWK